MHSVSCRRAAIWNLSRLGLLQPFADSLSAVQALVAVQAQDYPSARTAVCLRTSDCRDLGRQLLPGENLLRLWTVRGTLHLIPAAEADLHRLATAGDWFARWGHYLERHLPLPRAQLMQSLYPRLAAVLGEQPLDHDDICRLAELQPPYDRLLTHLLKDLCYLGLAVRGPDERGRASYYRYPASTGQQLDQATAQLQLLRRFIAAYGPVTEQDIVYWSGWRVTSVRAALQQLQPELASVQLQGQPDLAYLPATDLDDLMRIPEEMVVPELRLPAFDVLLLAYRNKRRFIDQEHVRRVFLSAARVLPVVLREGRVVGTCSKDAVQLFE